MKITKEELKNIKNEIPGIFKLISNDFFELTCFVDENKYKRVAFSLWDHWLKESELELIYSKSDKELRERQNIFIRLLKSLCDENEIFEYKYNNWKNKTVIEKPYSIQKLIKDSNLTNLSADGGGGFKLIIPKYKAILEMGYDWSGILIYKESKNSDELFEKIKNLNLFIIEFEDSFVRKKF